MNNLEEDFNDFFEVALCGFILTDVHGKITRANETIASWLGCPKNDLIGKRFSDLLTIGGKIYYETHLGPLLHMQGFFDEIALELSAGGKKLGIFVNALERRSPENAVLFVRITIFKGTDRRLYEQNLKDAQSVLERDLAVAKQLSLLREQFIAVLGHDLRNPLSSIIAGTGLLSRSSLNETDSAVVRVISKSAARMSELIGNVMDFARTRMGDGIVLARKLTDISLYLNQVVDEARTIWPHRTIKIDYNVNCMVDCDPSRIAQLFSNLLANGITHGAPDTPIEIFAGTSDDRFTLSVCNSGRPISREHIEKIFEPFTREGSSPSQNGLGLGLYIASQIARAHHGHITAQSDEKITCFTLHIPLN